jgi:hypothetical protein
VVARSHQDAKLVLREYFPDLVILECTRGAIAARRKTSDPHWSRGHLLTAPARNKRS